MQPPSDENDPPIPMAQTAQPAVVSRQKAIAAAFGILKGKGVFPEDALEYQLKLRAECD